MHSISPRLPSLLVLGDAVAPTGFSRVIREIIAPMRDAFEIHQLGVNYTGDAHDWPWTIYPARDAESGFGFARLPALLEEVQPALIFMLSDDVILARWMQLVSAWKGRAQARVLVYCPVDTDPVLPQLLPALAKADRLFTFTEFGRRCLLESHAKNENPKPLTIELMPHGIAASDFYPLHNDMAYHLSPEGKREAKRRLVHGSEEFDDAFIVLNANRNQERKRLDTTISGFARFAAGKPENVKLYLHCGIKDLGWNIVDLARQEGVLDRLIVSTTEGIKPAFPDSELNTIYGASDVGINTCSAEGWGLVSFEHAATGAAQLVPAHTGCGELWEGHAQLLPPSMRVTSMDALKTYYLVSPETVAQGLERLYRDKEQYKTLCRAAYRHATRPEYRWAAISMRWRAFFREELEKLPAAQQEQVTFSTVLYH